MGSMLDDTSPIEDEDTVSREHAQFNAVWTSNSEKAEVFVVTDSGKPTALFSFKLQRRLVLAIHVPASQATNFRKMLEEAVEEARHFEAKAQALAGPW